MWLKYDFFVRKCVYEKEVSEKKRNNMADFDK